MAVNLGMLGHQQVLNHRHLAEQANILEGTRQAGAVHQMGAAEHLVIDPPPQLRRVEKIVRVKLLPQHLNDIGDLFPRPQHDAPPRRPIKAGQAVKYRGFARAVGADQGGDRPPLHLQIDIIQRFDAAEMHHQMLNA